GRFFVHALPITSPAIEGGNPAGCLGPDGQPLATDQRGAPRHQRLACDIGAFELSEIVVTTTADGVTNNGDCTLREAIHATLIDAAVDACPPGFGDDLIRLPAGIYNLTIAPNPSVFHSGDLLIQKSVTIVGAGRNDTIIDGSRLDRVIQTAAAGTHVTLSKLRIRNGESKGGASGGGLVVGGSTVVTVTDSAITGNRAANLGGGIQVGTANGAGTLTLIRTAVSENEALGTAGGGLALTTGSTATLIDSTIRANTANGNGAGIFNNGTLRVERSTVQDNVGTRSGAGLSNNGTAVLVNSTISGNRAAMGAGGIINFNTLELNNVTIHLNTADSDGNNDGDGGGIAINAGSTTTVRNSIIAGNSDLSTTTQAVRDCVGALTSQGHNLLGDPFGCTGLTNGVQGDKVGTSAAPLNPNLNPLALNGGLTKSHLPRSGSPALDAGNPAAPGSGGSACAAVDQRGTPRPKDANDDGTVRCDIGAVEVASVGISTLTPTSGASPPEVVSTFTLTWTHPVRWRLLDNLDLRFAAGDEVILWVRYSEGFDPATATDTSTFSLLDAEGEVIATGRAGEDAVFETEWGALHLEQSSFQGTGAEGPDVTVHFAVSFAEEAAGRFYDLEVIASDDEGAIQGADEMGTWGVSPFHLYLPLVERAP
ncbi:MAG TPA: choice-of-anchor Q domain-containing protein, partial [Ardenticatenaceae bacterium]|nr:choice-of-anchor Q domain-containing protein [Ardenticatenaceae bacterium]